MEKSIESQREPAPQGNESPINASIAQAQPAAVQMKSALQESAAQETLTMAEKENQEEKMPDSLAEVLADLDAKGITDYRRYAAVKNYLCFKARDKGVPIAGTFELTPLCNLDCKMCYVHLTKEQMDGRQLLTVGQWKDLMCQAIDAGMMYASLTGGECLTYPGFDELYLYLQSMGVQISVLTNGVLMDEKRVEFFKINPPAVIQLTLYGADDDTYERVTGRRCFQQAYDGIVRLHEAGLPLIVSLTPSRYLGEGGDQLIRLAVSLGLPFNLNPGLFEARTETGRRLDDYDVSLDDYVRYAKLRAGLQHHSLAACPVAALPPTGGDAAGKRCGIRCGAGRSGFSISWDGAMHPCSNFNVITAHPMEQGFVPAWRQINAAAESYPLPTECIGCAYEGVCKGCALEHARAGVGHVNKRVCDTCKRMVSEGFIRFPGVSLNDEKSS